MSDKTIIFPNEGNNRNGGFDSDFLMGLLFGGGGFGGGFGGGYGGNWLLALIFFALFGGNFGGWGGNGGGFGRGGFGFLSNQLNDDAGRQLVMQAIQGNNNAIGQLSNMIGCQASELRNAISAINAQLCNLGNQVGMNSMQIINAINSGDAALANQLAQCCCDVKTGIQACCCDLQRDIATTNANLTRGFADVGYALRDQTCTIEKAIDNTRADILAGQRAAEMREMQREIAERDRELAKKDVIINNAQQTQVFGQMIAQATTPILQAVGTLQGDVNGIKCKLPNTVTLPYQEAQAVPNCVAWNYGLFGGFPGGGNGFWG